MNYSIYVESTPNPEVMKFVSNRMIADKSLEFLDASQAKNIPLANELFKLPFIKSVFISTNFVSINKTENVNWDDIALQVRMYISDYLNSIEVINHTDNIQSEPIDKIEEDSKGGQIESRRSQPPYEYRERFKAFLKGASSRQVDVNEQ